MEESVTAFASDCLLRIPGEVLYGCVFPYLKLNELLRLRRTCKQLKSNSDGYIRNHFTNEEREINISNNTFRHFIDCDFPTSKIFINNRGPEIFEDPDLREFIQLYAGRITHLRVKTLQSHFTPEMNKFFMSLNSLICLEIGVFYCYWRDTYVPYIRNANDVIFVQEKAIDTFRKLKILKFGRIQHSKLWGIKHALDFVDFCVNLEYIQLMDGNMEDNSPYHAYESCYRIFDYIETRLQDPHQPLKLKFYDLQGHWVDEFTDANQFADLCRILYSQNVKLLNFDASCFNHEDVDDMILKKDLKQFNPSIVSVQNLGDGLAIMPLPNLRKLTIKSTANSIHSVPYCGFPESTHIDCLDVTIDSHFTNIGGNLSGQPVEILLNGLFRSQIWNNLKDLRIASKKAVRSRFEKRLPFPRAEDIVFSCVNVTKLTLTNWIRTDNDASILWSGLEKLEEVVIEHCELMGDDDFVGSSTMKPAFLDLKNLKRLALCRLDKMSKITDLVFKLVFCHLKIIEFRVTSEHPVKSVTTKGFEFLIAGQFNQYVEKFPFSGWSLQNVSEEEFYYLHSRFRASHML